MTYKDNIEGLVKNRSTTAELTKTPALPNIITTGSVLLAYVSIVGSLSAEPTINEGWSFINRNLDGTVVTDCVFAKVATASESPPTITFADPTGIVYTVMSITGVTLTGLLTDSQYSGGSGDDAAICPAINNAIPRLELRLGTIGFGRDITSFPAGDVLVDYVATSVIAHAITANNITGNAPEQSFVYENARSVGRTILLTEVANIAPDTITPEDGTEQTINCSLMTGPITAATLGGVNILSLLSGTDPNLPITFNKDISATGGNQQEPLINVPIDLVFTTAADGDVSAMVTIQPKTGWIVSILADPLTKEANDYLTLIDSEFSITTEAGNTNYHRQDHGETITENGDYEGGTLQPYQFTEFVIQKGGSQTTASESYGGAFYPFGISTLAPVLAATKTINAVVGQALGQTLSISGGDTATSWSITGGADQGSYSLSNAGLLTRAANDTEETETIIITATNAAGTSNEQTISVVWAESSLDSTTSLTATLLRANLL